MHWNLSENVALQNGGVISAEKKPVNAIIYLVGLVVIVMAILSFVGIR